MFKHVTAYMNRSIWKKMARSMVICDPTLQPAAKKVIKSNAWRLAETAAHNNSKIFVSNSDIPNCVKISIFDDNFFELNKVWDFDFLTEKLKNPDEIKKMLAQFFKKVF